MVLVFFYGKKAAYSNKECERNKLGKFARDECGHRQVKFSARYEFIVPKIWRWVSLHSDENPILLFSRSYAIKLVQMVYVAAVFFFTAVSQLTMERKSKIKMSDETAG